MTEFRPTRFEVFVNGESLTFRFSAYGQARDELDRRIAGYRNEGRRCQDLTRNRMKFEVERIGIVEIRRTGTLFEAGQNAD